MPAYPSIFQPPLAGMETDTDESEAAGTDIEKFNEDEMIMPFQAPPLGQSVTSPCYCASCTPDLGLQPDMYKNHTK